jgi:hypothetical protein
MSGEETFGGELLWEEGRKGVLEKGGERWRDRTEDPGGRGRRGEVERREGKRKRDNRREMSSRDEEFRGKSRIESDA